MTEEESESGSRSANDEALRKDLDAWGKEVKRRDQRQKEEALALGKEPFDLDVFYETYLMAGMFADGPREEATVQWERRYFRSSIYMTVKDFAIGMNENDVYDGG